MKKSFIYLAAAAMFAYGTFAWAAPVPVSIDFGTGIGTGGTIVEVAPGDWHGTDIFIGAVNIANSVNNVDGGYTANALLNFDTDIGTISIVGTMGVDPSTGLNVSQTLFSGTIDSVVFNDFGVLSSYTANGGGGISAPLSAFIGEGIFQSYDFVEFNLNIGEDVRSTDLLLTASNRTPEVPIPAAAWLFGSGLLGLVGVARRKDQA